MHLSEADHDLNYSNHGNGDPHTEKAAQCNNSSDDPTSQDAGTSCHPAVPSTGIAVVGMACRLPGSCSSPSAFWDLLIRGDSPQSKTPEDRFNVDAFYHPRHDRPGSLDSEGGYFIQEDIRNFEPTFFGISAQEATTMDPQQRKVLEVAYEALESAGIPLHEASGSNTGCFVANFTYDFATMNYKDIDYATVSPYVQTGLGATLLSNRVSHVFNLTGPSVTLDTACSSACYALHLACQSIADGTCDGALVMGVNLMLTPEQYLTTSKLGVLSPTSRCHTFDASADGYARAEGVNALYIKRISAAVDNKDPVRAIIRSTSINANGKSPGGITNPNPAGQEQAMRNAYLRAGLDFDSTGYFECHGTGTYVGDPLEVQAVGKVFAGGRRPDDPLLIGSVKTNLGHGEAASGITSVMKAILAVENGLIPATVCVTQLNPNIDFKNGRLKVVTENSPWPTSLRGRRIASVNSFGYGGANAHVIVQDTASGLRELGYPRGSSAKGATTNGFKQHVEKASWTLLAFSAHSEASLKSQVKSIAAIAETQDIHELAYTLGARRSRLSRRAFSIVDNVDSPRSVLENATFAPKVPKSRALGFVFTGQGSQYEQMGLELFSAFPRTLRTIQKLDKVLQALPFSDRPSWTLEESLNAPAGKSRIHDAERSQPLCTALQVALVDLLRSWNIQPRATVGHSSGEIAAAYASGLISMEDAIKVAYYRGLHVSRNTKPGAMLATALSVDEARGYEPLFEGRLCVACVNSPQSLTVSGNQDDVVALHQQLTQSGIFNRLLRTGGKAYHSHIMAAIGPKYEDCLVEVLSGSLKRRTTSAPMFSSVQKGTIKTKPLPPSYWRENLESTVEFSSAVEMLLGDADCAVDHLIEIGPHSALRGPLREICEHAEHEFRYHSALERGKNAAHAVLSFAGHLLVHDYPVDLNSVNFPNGTDKVKTLTDLPPYPWDYSKLYWNESRQSKEFRFRKHVRHDILGSLIPGGDLYHPVWKNLLRIKDIPWVEDHTIDGAVLFPTSAYIGVAAEAALQMHEISTEGKKEVRGFELQNIVIRNPMVLQKDGPSIETLVSMQKRVVNNKLSDNSWYEFTISSCSNGQTWQENCSGCVRVLLEKSKVRPSLPGSETPGFRQSASAERWYKKFNEVGLQYGPAFQGLYGARATPYNNASVKATWHPTKNVHPDESRYFIHPATLDVCIHSAFVAVYSGNVMAMKKVHVPVGIDSMTFYRPLSKLETISVNSRSKVTGFTTLSTDVEAVDENTNLILQMKGVSLKALPPSLDVAQSELNYRTPFLRLQWKPDIESLSLSTAHTQFPGKIVPKLDELFDDINLLCILCIYQIVSWVDEQRLKSWYSKHVLSWMKACLKQVEEDTTPLYTRAKAITPDDRADKISALFDLLGDRVFETQLLRQLYPVYDRILTGKIDAMDLLWKGGLMNQVYDKGLRTAAAYGQLALVFDLLGHKNPTMKVLEIGSGTGGASSVVLEALNGDTPFKRYSTYAYTDTSAAFLPEAQKRFSDYADVDYRTLDIDRDPLDQGYEAGGFDVIFAANCFHATKVIDKTLQNSRKLLKPGGYLVLLEITNDTYLINIIWGVLESYWSGVREGRTDSPFLHKAQWKAALCRNGFSEDVIMLPDYQNTPEETTVMVARVTGATDSAQALEETGAGEPVGILYRNSRTSLLEDISEGVRRRGFCPTPLALKEYNPESPSNIIVLLDLEGQSFLTDMTGAEFESLQVLIGSANKIVWLVPGGIQSEESPEYGSIYGFARTACRENALTDFVVVSFDPEYHSSTDQSKMLAEEMSLIYSECATGLLQEREICLKDGVKYITRMAGDQELNSNFVREKKARPEEIDYASIPASIVDIKEPGRLDSLYFTDDSTHGKPLAPEEVEIDVRATGLSLKGLTVAMGSFDDQGLNWEFAGIISRVGTSVSSVAVGDRVVGLAVKVRFNKFVRTPYTLVQKVDASCSFEELATMPVSHVTAIHSLIELARLRKGETVLIQSASGALGQACIQIATAVGAKVFVTAGSESKRNILHTEFNIPYQHIFYSRDSRFVENVLDITEGRGINVVIATCSGELLRETFRCLSHFGRIVELGRSDVHEHAKIDLMSFRENISFYSFDFTLTMLEHPELCEVIHRHLATMIQLYSGGKIEPIKPIHSFHITELVAAFRDFASRLGEGKVVVNYGEAKHPQKIKYMPKPPKLQLDSNGAYLLVGALGGLGRSLSTLLVDRGAQSLVYLSRSGDSKPEAAQMIRDLRTGGVEVIVVKGSVSERADVDAAISAAKSPIRGVIQASMVLEDRLFSNMKHAHWTSCLQPKLQGTLNLHHSLLAHDQNPEFFLMLSSIVGYLGMTTQSNYAAANTFLDSFSRYRHCLGLPATSVALGIIHEVGYVSELTDGSETRFRHGVTPATEEEFLEIIETALITNSPAHATKHTDRRGFEDQNSRVSFLSGLEPAKSTPEDWEQLQRQLGFDRRSDTLIAAIKNVQRWKASDSSAQTPANSSENIDKNLREVLLASGSSAIEHLRGAVKSQLSKILLLGDDQIADDAEISEYGLDSLVGTEFRNWVFRTLGVQVGFLELLEPGCTTMALAKKIMGRMK